ncbi:hypothetical protein [uncultured Ruegeria sp.]|uniref:hypothetical protein n=2 Tax=uncultured Ruegeria sp. TaxID=259304 RepID=UPI00261EDF3E|nr:hypothetical protein [uncultured Ruegeria sp.]
MCMLDLKGDSLSALLSLKSDTAVTSYKNEGKNIKNNNLVGRPMPYIPIADLESGALESWKLWLGNHWPGDVFELLQLLRKAGPYMLPTRFPKNEDADRHLAFFNWVTATKGKELS